MWHRKSSVAVISVSLCLLAVSLAFVYYYGQIFQPSPLLNANFKFWTFDPAKNLTRPYLWEVDLIKGPLDNVTIYQFEVDGRASMALRVDRVNENSSSVWTTVHVRQDLRGQALAAIFRSTISLWVFPTFPYWYGAESKSPENAFGIEINDGTNLLWYIFSDAPSQVFQLPRHRIVLMQTPLNQWSLRDIDIAKQFEAAGWPKPDSISFILILGSTWVHPGSWVGYFSEMKVEVAPLQTESLSTAQIVTVFAIDAVVILALVTLGTFLPQHKEARRQRVRHEKSRTKGGR